MGLWLTFLLGFFIVLGGIIVFYTQNSDRFIHFSIALASSVIGMLILIDLIPEVFEIIPFTGWLKYLSILVGIAFGFVILYVLDKFIPDHEDDPKTKEDDQKNLEHIGLISSIALFLHNVVEGMAIYLLAYNDPKAAFMASLAVGLHNIPLGMIITSAFYQQNGNRKKTFLIISLIALSTFFGGLLVWLFPFENYIELVEVISLTITIGMLLFILIRELIPKMCKTPDKKISILGFGLGIVLLLIASMLA